MASFALVFTVGIMNGFEKAVKNGLLKNLPHLQIYLFDYKDIPKTEKLVKETLKDQLKSIYWVASFGLIIQKGPSVAGVSVITSDKETLKKFILPKLRIKVRKVNNCILVGNNLAFQLDIEKVPATVLLINPVAQKTPVGFLPKLEKYKVCGIYHTGFEAYDLAALAPYQIIKKNFEPSTYAVIVELKNPYKADFYRKFLEKELPNYYISTWIDSNRDFFKALQLEKLGMILVVSLITIVAAFNITALLFMKIKELQKDFAIFRTFGIGKRFITSIVLLLGFYLAILGGGLGIVSSLIIAKIFTVYKVIKVPEDVYLTSYLPVEPGIYTPLWVLGFIVITSLIASYIPAFMAVREKITDLLRNE